MTYRGYTESIDGGRVSGWAVDAEGGACELIVIVNGIEATRVVSDGKRGDLLRAGRSQGAGGFKIETDFYLKPGDNLIEMRFPDGRVINGSSFSRTVGGEEIAEGPYRGFIEGASKGKVRGWAVAAAGQPCKLTVAINGSKRLQCVSERPRADLVKRDMSKGLGGFLVDLKPYLDGDRNSIGITCPDGSHVRGSPLRMDRSGEAIKAAPAAAKPDAAKKPRGSRLHGAPGNKFSGKSAPPSSKAQEQSVAAVARLNPPRNETRASMPSLAELDELSLDDLSLAVASGLVTISAPAAEQPPLPEAGPSAAPAEPAAGEVETFRGQPRPLSRLKKRLGL